jgi:TPR repeat protein
MHFYGDGVEVNYQLAFRYYQIAADQGHADVRLQLGLSYKKGYGTEKDLAKAKEWYSKAANQNNSMVQGKDE